MMRRCTIAVLVLMSLQNAACAQPAGSQWKVGDPIVGYYQGPGGGGRFGPLTDENARQIAAAGFNLVWCMHEKELDIAHAHGLRALFYTGEIMDGPAALKNLDNPQRTEQINDIIDSVKDHPALYAYYVYDEPSAKQFPALARMVDLIRRRDPNHFALINLFPTYASAVALGTSGDKVEAYRQHLRLLIEIVKPDLISWDHYNFRVDEDNEDYFLNMALVREAAIKGGLPFTNVVQACSVGQSHRVPNGDEGRFLAYTTLAYGGDGIYQFVYNAFVPPFKGGVALKDGSLTPLGKTLKQVNPQFVAVGRQLQPLDSLGVHHLGVVPPLGEGLPADAKFRVDPPVPADQEKGILLGCFGRSKKPTHVLVVNLDYTQPVKTTVVGPGALEVFDETAGEWQGASNRERAEVKLMPGGGKLVRLRTGR